jgi:hypothetical protein
MPITLSVDHARRRVLVNATGLIQRADVARNLALRLCAGAVAYDQIWDLSAGIWGVLFDELRSIAADDLAALSERRPGLLVMVAPNESDFTTLCRQAPYLRYYGFEMKTYRSPKEAEAWLDAHSGSAR